MLFNNWANLLSINFISDQLIKAPMGIDGLLNLLRPVT